MPYIDSESRSRLDPKINCLIKQLQQPDDVSMVAGELNYVVTRLILAMWRTKKNYYTGNAIVGMLECAKAEFYRQHLAPYEDGKLKQNGDVS